MPAPNSYGLDDAVSTAFTGRDAGGGSLILTDNEANFGSPSPSAPAKIVVRRRTSPDDALGTLVTVLLATGRSGKTLTISGPAAGHVDAGVEPGDVVFIGLTSADMTVVHGRIDDVEARLDAPRLAPIHDATWASTSTIDWADGPVQRLTLQGPTALWFAGAEDGAGLELAIVQDATGGRTLTWPSGVAWIGTGGAAPPLGTAPGSITYLSFFRVGGSYWGWWGGDTTSSTLYVTPEGLDAALEGKQDALPDPTGRDGKALGVAGGAYALVDPPAGEQGPPGADGPQGPPGADGAQGEPGPPGDQVVRWTLADRVDLVDGAAQLATPALAIAGGTLAKLLVLASVNGPSGGFSFQVTRGGVSIFSAPQVVPAGTTSAVAFTSFSSSSIAEGDPVNVDVSDAGEGVQGVAFALIYTPEP